MGRHDIHVLSVSKQRTYNLLLENDISMFPQDKFLNVEEGGI